MMELRHLRCFLAVAEELHFGRYAALHAQTYGEADDAATLIPHMLEAFMAGDRGFRKGTMVKVATQKQP